jgi:Tol biopolymer transport system component
MKRLCIAALVSIVLLVSLGCGSASILAPSPYASDNIPGGQLSFGPSHFLWGHWDIRIDTDTSTAEIVPLRSTDFTCNVIKFLQPPASPINLLSISFLPGSIPQDGYFELAISIRHPFPGANKYNGFDVRGILLTGGTQSLEHDPTAIIAGDGETHLKNADGYTRWWNYPEFTSYGTIFGFTEGKLGPQNQPTATVNPYKYFADGLSSTASMSDLDTSNRGQFSTNPGINSRQYNIQFKMVSGQKVVDFQYAVDASWAAPDDSYDPEYPPEAYPLSANMAEPFMISTADAGSTAWFVNSILNGGTLILDIELFDWQGALTPDGTLGQLEAIWLEGPVLNNPQEVLTTGTVLSSNELSAKIRVTLDNLNLTKSGQEFLFVTILSSNPSTYKPQVPGGDSYIFPDAPLSAYFVMPVAIDDEEPVVPGPGKISWVSNQDGNPEIYRMQGDGSLQKRLTKNYDHDWEPTWSPDGTRIAWRRGGYETANIWVMNEDGSNQHQITSDGWDFDPEWHPSGDWIYYWSYNGEGAAGTKIWKVKPDGSNPQQVTFYDDEGAFAAPSINNAGTLITMEGPGPGGGPRDVWTAGIDGSNPVNLTNYPLWDSNPSFNTDGSKIIFSREEPSGIFRLVTMNLDGTSAMQVAFPPDGQNDFAGVFGLNDEYIIVWRRTGASPDNDEIGKYIIASSEFIQLTNNNAYDQYPDWNPND